MINCMNPGADMEPCGQCESCVSFQEGRSYCIHELDAASNNSVEDIKTLMEQVQVPPQVGRYSVYIIDEVHMLSQAAFNAFLKTLEEPPAHAIFILATTEKHKILPTILSRCQTYDFNRISIPDMVRNLRGIASKEGITIDDESLHVIASKADGAMRDALTIFDQTVAFCGTDVRYEDVIRNLNVLDYEYSFRMVDDFLGGNYGDAFLTLDEILSKGFNALHFVASLSSHLRNLVVAKTGGLEPLLELPESLKKLALLIGRAGEDEIAAKGRFLTASKSDIEGITVGNNLSALLPSEVALLSDRNTQDIFYRNYAEKRLQVFASASQSTRPDEHKDGPVIICVDESSSMTGEPLKTAITLAYAVTIIAKRRHRQVLIVAYSDSHKMMRVESLGRQKKQLMDFLSNVSMGGNNENSMFKWLFRDILPREKKFKTADILCISDFGWVRIDHSVKMLIDEQKASGMKFYGLNIGGVFGGWAELDEDMWDEEGSPMSVCDSVWEYHNGQCKEGKKPS